MPQAGMDYIACLHCMLNFCLYIIVQQSAIFFGAEFLEVRYCYDSDYPTLSLSSSGQWMTDTITMCMDARCAFCTWSCYTYNSAYHHSSPLCVCSTTFDTPEWKACISQPSLPYVLKMLTGLCRLHSKTQLAIVPVISEVHLLEQVASDEHIGTMAENLLEAMMENPTCEAEVQV